MASKERVKVFIDKEMKLQNLDQLLLFLTSILGLFFSLVYVLYERLVTAIGFIPILILGLVVPIYIGYVRGALLIDSLEERVRGWIYFIYGITVYIASLLTSILRELLIAMNIEFETLSLLVVFVGSMIIGYSVGGGKIYRWFCRTILDAFSGKTTTLTNKIFKDTAFSAFTLGLFMYMAFSVFLSGNFNLSDIVLATLGISMGVAMFVWSERDIRKLVCFLQFSEHVEIEEQRSKTYVPSEIGNFSFLISVVLLGCSIISLDRGDIFATSGLLAVGVLGQIIYFLSVGRIKSTSVKKKRQMKMSKEKEMKLARLLEQFSKK